MCGIAGLWQFTKTDVDRDRLTAMSEALASRGPDHAGIWTDGSLGMAHRRLSIVDITDTGSQPMKSPDGNYIVVFNGEIYNYQQLRDELLAQGVTFRSTSDTEILLHLYAREGEKMLTRLRGMFAFAIWDAPQKRIFFARDRIGKKPFFYTYDREGFAFASEIKALLAHQPRPTIDHESLRLFFGLQYIPAPRTGFIGIHNLPPAHYGFVTETGSLTLTKYDTYERTGTFEGTYAEASQEVRRLLDESVRLRMVADVPVGTFLSGGIDSSAIAVLMARASSEPIQTFTMGFPSFGFDERHEARELARRIGAEHHEYEAHPENIPDMVDAMVRLYDAPYADSSCVPTWLLARATRQHVKAVMTGDGGDELFVGYRRYRAFLRASRIRARGLDRATGIVARGMGMILRDPRYLRFSRLLDALRISDAAGYASLFTGSYFSSPDEATLLQPHFAKETRGLCAELFVQEEARGEGLQSGLRFDLHSYLPDDLNVKMDRATMAHGLEARSPFLDQELIRFVMTLPLSMLLQHDMPKPLLRSALGTLLPKHIFKRPKRGFQVPLAEWFRKDLHALFEERCLASGMLIQTFCQPQEMRRYLHENDRGRDHGNRLWMLLMLSSWLQQYG